jgi:hypothetical protein
MWRSVFLHEFPDTNILHFQALAGHPTDPSLDLTPRPSPPLQRIKAVGIVPGRGFRYLLEDTLDQVIGISGRVRVRFPFPGGSPHPIPIMQLGNQVEFQIFQKPLEINPGVAATAPLGTARLRIGQTVVELGTVNLLPMPPFWFTELRFDWHTSGPTRLLQDGKLVGYHNAVEPGIWFDIPDVRFGMPDLTPATEPGYSISRVFVHVLRRPDPPSDFSKLVPAIPFPDQERFELCQLLPINNLLAMTDRVREFMSLIHRNLSQPWTASSGPAEGPLQPEGIAAHELAKEAVVALTKMIRAGDFSTEGAFLEPFEGLLRVLHDAQPAEFTSLVDELTNISVVPEECSSVAQEILEKNKETLGPIVDMLSKANDRLRDVAGGL